MRVVFDKNGYLDKWIMNDDGGVIPDENEQVIPTPKDIDISTFYEEYHLYHLVDGELVKDETREKPQVVEQPTQLDIIEAQVAYIAMMTGNSDILEV